MSERVWTMRTLVDYLNETARRYYVDDNPIISDAQWDALYAQLVQMEADTGTRLPDSPTRRVGGEPVSAFVQHRHISRLWSMDKVQSRAELMAWFARVEALHEKLEGVPPLSYCVEYKFDGLTVNLTYENGLLAVAATRGNGEVGEMILPQVRTVNDIPLSIPYQGQIEIQGECIMRLSVLKAYNQNATEKLKNARNAAAGALRNLDPRVTASRRLSTYFYDIGTIENPPYTEQAGLFSFIEENGFPVSQLLMQSNDKDALADFVAGLEEGRHNLDFLIDGAVIKVADLATRRLLGYTDKFPRWAVAYKFTAEESTTSLLRVTWEVGRTGKLTPLAHVDDVEFAGATVRKATLNNWGDMQRKGLTQGCTVWIRRSNDVIPEITGCVDDGMAGEPFEKPTHCPACGTELNEVGAHLFCPNRLACRPQVVARLTHFASRDAMDITTFSEKTAELFYDRLDVREPADLYRLTREQLLMLPGFKDKKADNLLEALAASKVCTLDAFLLAVGIPNIGKATARDLAQAFGTLEAIRQASVEQLQQVDEIGDVIAASLREFFEDEVTNRVIDDLLQAGVHPHAVGGAQTGTRLAGKTVVITGTLPTLSRQQAEDLVRAHGGMAAGSVSRRTAFVVAGEGAGKKLTQAQTLGIEVMDEAAFLKMLEQ
jgi:DNA ligase (NAD+)